MAQQSCPICGASLEPAPRYPLCVCQTCAARATDEQGARVEFFNTQLSGGLEGRYVQTGLPYAQTVCFIGAVRCRAEEARFGGIVIQVQESS